MKLLKPIIVSLATLLLLVFYTNCDSFEKIETGSFNILSARLSDNAEGFEGKIDEYKRFVPGHTCDGQTLEYAKVHLQGQKASIYTNHSNECGKVSSINIDGIVETKNTDEVIAHREGIYTKASAASQSLVFTEAWCHSRKTSDIDLDVVVKASESDNNITLQIFDLSKWERGSPIFTVDRTHSGRRLAYESQNLHTLSINLIHNVKDWTDHQFEASIASDFYFGNHFTGRIQLVCRLGGQFDPVAPKITYKDTDNILVKDQPVVSLVPYIDGNVTGIVISPELPGGLNFNVLSGEISGTPMEYSATKEYTITAQFKYGSVFSKINLGVGKELRVNSNTSRLDDRDVGDGLCENRVGLCDLKTALDEVNSHSNHPFVVHLPNETFSIHRGFVINGDVKLIGQANTIIDANKSSRIFTVESSSGGMWLESITLRNGRANGNGGAIYSNRSNLRLDNVIVENSETYHHASQGGGIHSNLGSLKIFNSTFRNNHASHGESSVAYNVFGGALYAHNNSELVIDGSHFVKNSSFSGGAIYVKGLNEIAQITNTKIHDNSSQKGGGIYINSGSTYLNYVEFVGNKATLLSGGALFADNYRDLVVANSLFRENIAIQGSSIYNKNGFYSYHSLKIYDTHFVNNRVDQRIYGWGVPSGYSIANYHGDIHFKRTTFDEIPLMVNCLNIYEESIGFNSYFVDLGGNQGGDGTCGYKDDMSD